MKRKRIVVTDVDGDKLMLNEWSKPSDRGFFAFSELMGWLDFPWSRLSWHFSEAERNKITEYFKDHLENQGIKLFC